MNDLDTALADDPFYGGEPFLGVPALTQPLSHFSRVSFRNDVEPPTPEFNVGDLVPKSVATLFASHGGFGKSSMILTLIAHIACGVRWAGLRMKQQRCLYVSLEDAEDIVLYRLGKIAREYSLDPDVVADNVTILDGSALEMPLVVEQVYEGVRTVVRTAAMYEVEREAVDHGFIAIDNASDAFGGNENDRGQVRAFIKMLNTMAKANNACLALLAHVDKAGARDGTKGNSYSGSTAWHNSVRSRLALVKVDGQAMLVHEKSNFWALQESISIEWQGPVPVPKGRDRVLESMRAEKAAGDDADLVMHVIELAVASGITVTAAQSGSRTTYHVLKDFPEMTLPDNRAGKARFWAAITKLRRDSRIVEVKSNDHYGNKKLRLEPTKSKHELTANYDSVSVEAE